jgi:hypothetical protein
MQPRRGGGRHEQLGKTRRLLMALIGHRDGVEECPGVGRKADIMRRRWNVAYDPKRSSTDQICCNAQRCSPSLIW